MATAKKTTKQTSKKTATKSKQVEANTTSVLRKGTLVYLGIYGFAAERAAKRAEQVKALYTNATNGLFDDLVSHGEKVEELALETAKTAQKRVIESFETTTSKVKAAAAFGANDRVEELEAEIVTLNEKITALSKKASTPRKKASTSRKKASTSRKKTGINKQVMATEKTISKVA